MPADSITIERVDHLGVRVRDAERAIAFYAILGFEVIGKPDFDAVVILRNAQDVELNLIVNANDDHPGTNILMDVETKHAGITHVALRVPSIPETIEILNRKSIEITQGPVIFSGDGHVSVFIRDPDRNTIELRAREEDLDAIEGLEQYDPNG
jgi:catechol 2,3-dioxygenase-like lactoylglutathione lyase family enzyme